MNSKSTEWSDHYCHGLNSLLFTSTYTHTKASSKQTCKI